MSNTVIEYKLTPYELKNISYFFLCNVIDNVQRRASVEDGTKWGKEDASELIAGAIDTIRSFDDAVWQDLRATLLERYKGR